MNAVSVFAVAVVVALSWGCASDSGKKAPILNDSDTADTDLRSDVGPDSSIDLGSETDAEGDAGPPVSIDNLTVGSAFVFGDILEESVGTVGYFDGTEDILTFPPLAGVDYDVSSLAVSPDGAMLVVGGHDADEASDTVYVFDTADVRNRKVLYAPSGLAHEVKTRSMTFSPDGQTIAFLADIERNRVESLYVIPREGGPPKQVSFPAGEFRRAVFDYTWVDNSVIAFVGQGPGFDQVAISVVDITSTSPSPIDLLPASVLTANQGVAEHTPGVDAEGRIYFTSDHEVDDLFRLMRVRADGTGLEQVPGTEVSIAGSEASIPAFRISPSGDSLAFATEPVQGNGQVYVLSLDSGTSRPVTQFSHPLEDLRVAAAFLGTIEWSPQQDLLLVVGDWPLDETDMDDANSLFVVSVDDDTAVRVAVSRELRSDAQRAYFASDQSRIFLLSDLVVNNNTELFVLSDFETPDQDLTPLRKTAVPDFGDVFDVVPIL